MEYPDNRYLEFREAAARFVGLGVAPQNIIPGNGSTEIVRLVVECVARKRRYGTSSLAHFRGI